MSHEPFLVGSTDVLPSLELMNLMLWMWPDPASWPQFKNRTWCFTGYIDSNKLGSFLYLTE